MDAREKIEHEAIKNVLKMYIINCKGMNSNQKVQAMESVDVAAQKADWITDLLRQCGYYK